MSTPSPSSPEQALAALRRYCAYRERNRREVWSKLSGWGFSAVAAEELIQRLVGEGWLHQQRYATAFAGGKFRVNRWGKQKIRMALRHQKVAESDIAVALENLHTEEYLQGLAELMHRKWRSLSSETDLRIRRFKTQQYLLRKGYENERIIPLLQSLAEETTDQ